MLDSSLLCLPSDGYVSPTDPRWLSTSADTEEELLTDIPQAKTRASG